MNGSRAVFALILVASMALLAGCGNGGFRPMYADAALGGLGASEKLAKLEVAPIPGRVGQRIRNEMIFESTGGALPAPPVYRLEIALRESVTSTLVKIDGDAQGNTFNLDASFRIVRISDKVVVLEGASYGRAAFEKFDSVFADVRARRDAEDRAARTVAADLKSRLTAFLATAA